MALNSQVRQAKPENITTTKGYQLLKKQKKELLSRIFKVIGREFHEKEL